jgi:hypothetical protein
MEALKVGDLTIEVTELDAPPTIRLNWLGISNERQPEKILAPFFEKVLAAAVDASRSLALHFEQIERFNSSTILAIIHLIQAARHRKVQLLVVYDPTRKWQRLSFDALRIFDKKDGLFELRPVEQP